MTDKKEVQSEGAARPQGGAAAPILLPIVPGQESPLASGMAPAREAELAGAMPEVPKGR